MRRMLALVLASAFLLFTLAGCGKSASKNDGQNAALSQDGSKPAEESTAIETGTKEGSTAEPQETEAAVWKAVLYFPDKDAMYVVKEERTIKAADDKGTSAEQPDLAEKAKTIVEELIKGPENPQLSATCIPNNTKVLSVTLDGSTITLDLSQEFEKDHIGGSTGILMTFAPIVLSLTELQGVDAVSFKIEGKTVEDFKGHISLNRPFKRSEYEHIIAK